MYLRYPKASKCAYVKDCMISARLLEHRWHRVQSYQVDQYVFEQGVGDDEKGDDVGAY